MKHVVILTPSRGQVSLAYRDTFVGIALEAERRSREGDRTRISVLDETTPGLVDHSRNVLFGHVLEHAQDDAHISHAFWWDSDVAFAPHLLFDLLERPEPMICRPYPMRGTTWDGVAALIRDFGTGWPSADALARAGLVWLTPLHFVNGAPVWSEDAKLVRVRQCGFGWVLMRIEAMRSFWQGELGPGASPVSWMKDVHGRALAPVFDPLTNADGTRQGEDVSFCARWRDSGRQIWAAPDGAIVNGDRRGTFADYLIVSELYEGRLAKLGAELGGERRSP